MERTSAVDRLYHEACDVVADLEASKQISLALAAKDHFRKSLLLAAASRFEYAVTECVLAYIAERAVGSHTVRTFVQKKALERQYHALFDWKSKNANYFFGLFGDELRSAVKDALDENLKASIQAFMELGSERNKLVHGDYATFPMEKTLEEVYDLYKSAMAFVEFLPTALRLMDERPNEDENTTQGEEVSRDEAVLSQTGT